MPRLLGITVTIPKCFQVSCDFCGALSRNLCASDFPFTGVCFSNDCASEGVRLQLARVLRQMPKGTGLPRAKR
ncbi:hypothetical protein LY56_00727 [Roseinatronobacter thiooxidans]|uniref:Uncharacterized protein n=1 Tax=Roseinatronobacter thiooxidans TaxID=121821 RepID=A0A2W7R002_9RHOB|nr:hypothetical protein LY56_00727 [Roseinatronobacter thiooxidans]